MEGKSGTQPHAGLITLGLLQETDRDIAAEIAARDVPVGLHPRFVAEVLRDACWAEQSENNPLATLGVWSKVAEDGEES